jgi:tetratricopeptide (TPR) repeat protein
MAKRWKKAEITYLKRYAGKRHVAELAQRFRTNNGEVSRKLTELGLEAKDSASIKAQPPDRQLSIFEQGLKALHQNKWREASKCFEEILEETGESDLAQRARRYLGVCRQNLARTEPRNSDPFLLAVYESNRGNYDEALALCSRGGRQSKDERFAYLAASVYCLTDDLEKAAKFLALAIELNPKNRVHAFHDSDFNVLRDSPEYRHLFD